MMSMNLPTFGDQVRQWRLRRHLSQQALAECAELSPRHLSFLETGRAAPSREMVLRLAERLDVPLRERNPLLQAAGYAPMYKTRDLDAPEMQAARHAIDVILRSHLPNPALAFDRTYDIVSRNAAADLFLQGVAPELLAPRANVIRISLHPEGLAGRIVNLHQWRRHILDRMARQHAQSGDPALRALIDEVTAYPVPADAQPDLADEHPGVLMPFLVRAGPLTLRFVSTVTVFGSPHDIVLQELAIESFFPADDATAAALAKMTSG